MNKHIINTTGRPFNWHTVLDWCDRLDVDVVYYECDTDMMLVRGSEIDVNLLESAIDENTDKYIEEYLWGRIKDYICPFYDKCTEKCSSRYDVHFNENGCPWGFTEPHDGGFENIKFEEGYTMEFDLSEYDPSNEEEIE